MDIVAALPDLLGFFEGHGDLLALLTAATGGGVALQRHRADQAWKKKQFAFDFVQKIFDDARAMAALRMLDWDSGWVPEAVAKEFGLQPGECQWDQSEVARALRVHDADTGDAAQGLFDRKEYTMRALFDACLSDFDRLGHFLRTRVIGIDDVPAAIAYYPQLESEVRCADRLAALHAYMDRYKYTDAKHLFVRVAEHYRG